MGYTGTISRVRFSLGVKGDVESLPIVSRSFVSPWVPEHDGFGMRKTTSGQKSIQNISNDGFTVTPAKMLGTNRCSILKVGARKCLMSLHFLSMVCQVLSDRRVVS